MTIVLDGSSGITAPGGTAAAPSITTTGDVNTGIFFPAADTIAFTEGGAESMRISSSGNLGISEGNAPTQVLSLYRSGSTNAIMSAGNSNTGLNGTLFGVDTAGNGIINQTQAFATIFSTSNTERMRLDSSGNLGLGVTPSAWSSGKAYETTAAGHALWALSNEINVTQNAYFNSGWKYGATAAAARYQQQSGEHKWHIAASGTAGNAITFTQAMTLDASGNLGIGTSSPQTKLAVETSGTQNVVSPVITGQSTGTTYAGMYTVRDGAGDQRGLAWQVFTANVGLGEKMRLSSDGNLGIGTTSPAVKLQVKSSAEAFRIEGTTARGSGNIYASFHDPTGRKGYWGYGDSADNYYISNELNTPILFLTNAVERARIHAGGGMTIGGTTDDGVLTSIQPGETSVQLSLRDSTNTRRFIFMGSGYYGYQIVQRIYSNGGKAVLFANASDVEVGSIVINSGGVAYNTTSDYRLKDNPQSLTGSGAFIDGIKPKTWVWKADGTKGVGFIAHELAEVAPLSVSGEKDAVRIDQVKNKNGQYVEKEIPSYQSVDYGSAEIIANLVAEIQSLRARVAQLETK